MSRAQWQSLLDDQLRALISSPVSVPQLQATTAATLHATVAATGALSGSSSGSSGDLAPIDARQILERIPLPNAGAINPLSGDATALVTRDARHLQALCSWVDFLWRRLRPVNAGAIDSLSAATCLSALIATDRANLTTTIADPDEGDAAASQGQGATKFLCAALEAIQTEAERTLLPHLLVAVLRLVEVTAGRSSGAAATASIAVGGTVLAQLRAVGAMIGRWGTSPGVAAAGGAITGPAQMFEVTDSTQRAVTASAAYVAALLKPGADPATVSNAASPNLAEYFPVLAIATAKASGAAAASGGADAASGAATTAAASSLAAFDAATILDLTAAMQKFAAGLNALPAGESASRQIAEETMTELASLVTLAAARSSLETAGDANAVESDGAADAAAARSQQQQTQYLWSLLRERRIDDAVPLLETALRAAATLTMATPAAAVGGDGAAETARADDKAHSKKLQNTDGTGQLRLLFKRELAAAEAELKEIKSAAAATSTAGADEEEKPRAITASGKVAPAAASSSGVVPKAMEVLKPSTPVPPLSSFALQIAEIVASESVPLSQRPQQQQELSAAEVAALAFVPGAFDGAPAAAAKRAVDTLPFVTGTHSRFHAFPPGECGRPQRFAALFAPVEGAPTADAAGGGGDTVVRCGVSRRWAESNVAWARAAWTSSVATVVACEPTERRLAALATSGGASAEQSALPNATPPLPPPPASVLATASVHKSIPPLLASNAAATRKVLACAGGGSAGGAAVAAGAHPDGYGGCGGIHVGWADAALLVPELFA
jgi:hypothetical protein